MNASPDLGAQISATPALWPKGQRQSPIKAVILTNGDIDHVAGLLTLRESSGVSVHALAPVHNALQQNPVFSALKGHRVEAVPAQPFEVAGLSLELFPVPGKVALYLEGEAPVTDSQNGETAGVLVRDGTSTLAYVPGCAAITPLLEEKLAVADAVMFDGTLFTDEEMITAGLGQKTGRRMGHMPISGVGGSLEFLARLPARDKLYVHLNNSNPAWIDGSPERIEIERAGVRVAYDGLEIAL